MRIAATALVLLAGCGARSGLLSTASGDDTTSRDGAVHADRPRLADAAMDRSRPDHAPSAPCAPLAKVERSFSEAMAICRIGEAGSWVSQCGAAKLCGPGWRLCRPAEYRSRFGSAAGPPGVETTWIGGCVMSGGVAHLPTETACASCPSSFASTTTLGWGCATDTALAVQGLSAGVVSHPECYRIGKNVEATAAHWAPSRAAYLLRQAFCCRE